MTSAREDLGAALPPRWKIYSQARELSALAELAMSCSTKGPTENLPRARAALDQMRALLGEGE